MFPSHSSPESNSDCYFSVFFPSFDQPWNSDPGSLRIIGVDGLRLSDEKTRLADVKKEENLA
jgi:hypothetical protein